MSERLIPFSQLAKAGYNRGISRAHVNKIKRDFHEDMVQPAIVSFRDAAYYVVDHQHQTQAIYELNGCDPNTLIKCDVRVGLTYEQEADLYYRLNTGSKALQFADKIVGLIEAKDPDALEFRDVVEQCGYVIGSNSSNSIRAVSAAWKIFQKSGGRQMLERILSLTHACWPGNVNGVDRRIMEGLEMFLTHHGEEYQAEHFVKTLSPVNPRSIAQKATAFYKQMDSKTFTRQFCMYTVLVNTYNTGLRNKLVAVTPGT